jgi:predicted secreted hydrolase
MNDRALGSLPVRPFTDPRPSEARSISRSAWIPSVQSTLTLKSMKHVVPLCILLLSLLTLTASAPAVYKSPYPIEAVSLPRDEAAHPAPIEWWYYTGHLADNAGHEYGFELSFFKAYTPPDVKLFGVIPAYALAEKGHVAHFAITDKTKATFEAAEKAGFWTFEGEASSEELNVRLSDWYARRSPDGISHDIYATLGNRRLKLTLTPEKPAALHGSQPGIQSMGPGGVSYYVSYTRMRAKGELSFNCTHLDCDQLELSGQAWHDHQWGDFDLSRYAGWDWFGLQFDNHTELMMYLIRRPDGSYIAEAGSFVTAEGETIAMTKADFDVEVIGTPWESERTGGVYPLGWRITAPAYGIDVSVSPVLPDQEMDTKASTGLVYWEGAVTASGSHKGVGYVELTNYDLYPYGQTNTATPLQRIRGPFDRKRSFDFVTADTLS